MTVPVTQLPPQVEQTNDRQTLTMQTVSRKTAKAVNAQGAPSNVLGPIKFTAAGQTIKILHKLARQPADWRIVDVTGGYGVFQRIAWDTSTISIQSSNACTIMMRVA